MAKEEEKDAPAYIDYSGASTDGETWTGTDVLDHFRRKLLKKHNTSNLDLYTIQNRTLAKRLNTYYPKEQITQMVDEWMKKPVHYATSFPLFYKERYVIMQSIKERQDDYGWDD